MADFDAVVNLAFWGFLISICFLSVTIFRLEHLGVSISP